MEPAEIDGEGLELVHMRAIYATDLSAAGEAAIETETCLDCLGRIGIDELHLVTAVPDNVHAGTPGIDHLKRRRRTLERYQQEIEAAGLGVETHVVRGTPIVGSTASRNRSGPTCRSSGHVGRVHSRTDSSARRRGTSHGRRSCRCSSIESNAGR